MNNQNCHNNTTRHRDNNAAVAMFFSIPLVDDVFKSWKGSGPTGSAPQALTAAAGAPAVTATDLAMASSASENRVPSKRPFSHEQTKCESQREHCDPPSTLRRSTHYVMHGNIQLNTNNQKILMSKITGPTATSSAREILPYKEHQHVPV